MQYYDKALAHLNRSIELDPTGTIAYLYRGLVYEATGREEDATADYSRAIELEPGLSDLLASLRSEIPRR